MDPGQPQHAHDTGPCVHLDFGELRPERHEAVAALVRSTGAISYDRDVPKLFRDVPNGNGRRTGAWDDHAVADVEARNVDAEDFRCGFEQVVTRFFGGHADGGGHR